MIGRAKAKKWVIKPMNKGFAFCGQSALLELKLIVHRPAFVPA
jgi:hypothetical protein